jgi:hypothetical protein
MARGYKLAADLLVAQAGDRGFDGRRQLVYPIAFCYRHFLELTLKTLLEEYGPMANVELDRRDHELQSLWADFRKLLGNLNRDEAPEKPTNDIIEKCVAEFAKIDPESQTFRYPTRKNGQPFKLVLPSIDLAWLNGTMQKIDTYFGCVGSELYRIEEDRSTMLAMWY